MSSAMALGGSIAFLAVLGMLGSPPRVGWLRTLSLLFLAVAGALLSQTLGTGDLIRMDGWAKGWQILFLCGAAPLVLLARAGDEVPFLLVLGSVLGMSLLAVSKNFLLLFLGLELMSLPAYILVYSLRRSDASLEAAVKYFFCGGAAGTLFLLGLATAYARSGSLEFSAGGGLASDLPLALMGTAALFKIGAFPLHFWLPDVYEAASPELTGFLSTSMKAAGFLFLMRLLSLGSSSSALAAALPAISGCTMTWGNLLALRQDSLPRLLAYSSLAHAGYLLLGVAAWRDLGGTPAGASSVYLYLASYLAMNAGAFAIVRLADLRRVSDIRGWSRKEPRRAAFLALMLLSLAGIPPTAGFLAKLLVFWDAVQAGRTVWVVLAAANSLVGLAYYFRLIGLMYLETEEGGPPPAPPTTGWESLREQAILWGCAVPTLLIGILPQTAEFISRWFSH